jgi:allophanate hydrolase
MTTPALPAIFDLQSLRAYYAAGGSPAAIVKEVHRRIAALDDHGIFITLIDETTAVAAANALAPADRERLPLFGLPFAVKDNIDVAGLPTTAACPGFAYQPAVTAACVQRLLDAGAILIGKTNLDQFATGLVGVRSPYPIPKNAIDPALAPGGSSSGSAVAVARGIVTFALGTDTASSRRWAQFRHQAWSPHAAHWIASRCSRSRWTTPMPLMRPWLPMMRLTPIQGR